MTEGDLPAKVRWANDEVVNSFIGIEGKVDLEGTKRWFAGQLADPDTFLFAVTLDDAPVGYAKIIAQGDGEGEYHGSAIGEPAQWGKGYGKVMIDLILHEVFEVQGWDRFWGHFPAWNERSIGVHVKMGFTVVGKTDYRRLLPHEGKEYDVMILAMTRDEYQAR
jgi:RimJ/RimL family protein N-acetyltransferase